MGLFDSLAKHALGGLMGGSNQGNMLNDLLSQAGGLNGLKEQFQKAGLGDAFSSWVSTDQNQTVQPSQLESALGSDAIRDLAAKLGFDVKMVLPLLSQFLPQVIDKLTPNGAIEDAFPPTEKLQEVLGSVMKGGLSGLFGGRS